MLVNLIILFGVNLLTLFCKLDFFIAMQQTLCMLEKGLAFKKVWESLNQNSFMRSTPALTLMNAFLLIYQCL